MYTNRGFGTAECVLFIVVSSFLSILIREVPLYINMQTQLYILLMPNCSSEETP